MLRSIGSTDGRQKFSGGFLLSRIDLVRAFRLDHHMEIAGRDIDAAGLKTIAILRLGRLQPLMRAICSARIVVKVAGICWVMRIGWRNGRFQCAKHREQGLRAAGRGPDGDHVRRLGRGRRSITKGPVWG